MKQSKAYKSNKRETGEEPRLPGLNLTNDQVFFLSFAQVSPVLISTSLSMSNLNFYLDGKCSLNKLQTATNVSLWDKCSKLEASSDQFQTALVGFIFLKCCMFSVI